MSDRETHRRKKIAPIVITVVTVLYYLLFFVFIAAAVDSLIFRIILGVMPLAFAGVMIYVCMQRIEEIEGGEEDDLSKY